MTVSGKRRLSRGARVATLIGLSGVLVACGTTAYISVQQSRITRIVPLGTSTAVCDGVTADSATLLRFSLVNQRNEPVLENSRITVGDGVRSLDLDSVRDGVSLRRVRYFVEPEISCTQDSECAAAGYDDFKCMALSPDDEANSSARKACAFVPDLESIPLSDRGLSEDIPAFSQADLRAQPKLVLALFANGRTIQGQADCFDATGDPACYPDSNRMREQAFRELREYLPANDDVARSHRLCAGAFSISQGLEEIRYINNDLSRCFEPIPSERLDRTDIFDDYNSAVSTLLRGQFPAGERNVWGAAYDALDQLLNNASGQLRSRLNVSDLHIVLFTDGPDSSLRVAGDALRDRSPASVEQLIHELEDKHGQKVRVHIVQFDPQKQLESSEGDVFWSPYGPIDEYAQFACKTGGQYHYVTSIESLSESYATIAMQTSSYLQGVMRWPAMDNLPESGYLVSGTLSYDIHGSLGSAVLGGGLIGQIGAQSNVDNRFVIFARGGASVTPPANSGDDNGDDGSSDDNGDDNSDDDGDGGDDNGDDGGEGEGEGNGEDDE